STTAASRVLTSGTGSPEASNPPNGAELRLGKGPVAIGSVPTNGASATDSASATNSSAPGDPVPGEASGAVSVRRKPDGTATACPRTGTVGSLPRAEDDAP